MDALTTNYVLLRVQTKGRYKHETIADYLPKEVFSKVEVVDEVGDYKDGECYGNNPYISF
tara:strand:+ start:1328 stop:1507 length:180 start_codon:yes stop_codon:yes gene_type:complete